VIYVDDMGLKADVRDGHRTVSGKWSHLYADTHEELMTMAALIGLNSKWIQHPGTGKEHFDVVQSKRAAGARPVSWRHAGEFFAARREAARQEPERQAESQELDPDRIPRGKPVDLAQAAREADVAARDAFGKGDHERALTWLAAAKELDPGNAALFEQHERQVRTALPIVPRRRECSRCGEPGSQYPNGEYRCDGHKPQPAFQPAREVALAQEHGKCPTCETADLTYGRAQCQACGAGQGQEPRDIAYRDLSHGKPGHMCIQSQREERQPS